MVLGSQLIKHMAVGVSMKCQFWSYVLCMSNCTFTVVAFFLDKEREPQATPGRVELMWVDNSAAHQGNLMELNDKTKLKLPQPSKTD